MTFRFEMMNHSIDVHSSLVVVSFRPSTLTVIGTVTVIIAIRSVVGGMVLALLSPLRPVWAIFAPSLSLGST